MNIWGIFRGFPGLGRVVSGVSILQELRRCGHEVRAWSYLKGKSLCEQYHLPPIIQKSPERIEISDIGLNPIGRTCHALVETVLRERPDIVLIDGEALLVQALATVYPRTRLIVLLNPADVWNPSLPVYMTHFYHQHYLAAGTALIHGFQPPIDRTKIARLEKATGCRMVQLSTILREEVLQLSQFFPRHLETPRRLIGILGGGSCQVSSSFLHSTVAIGRKMMSVASQIPDSTMEIFCNDEAIAEILRREDTKFSDGSNLRIYAHYQPPERMYLHAAGAICRAGRNTISELLYLGIPTILLHSQGDFRSQEQQRNMQSLCASCHATMMVADLKTDDGSICKFLQQGPQSSKPFIPGNHAAVALMKQLMNAR